MKNSINFIKVSMQKIKIFLKRIFPVGVWQWLRKPYTTIKLKFGTNKKYIHRWSKAKAKINSSQSFSLYPDGINLVGYLQTATGLGESARSLHRALKTTSLSYNLIDYHYGISEAQLKSTAYSDYQDGSFKYNINLFHVNPNEFPILWANFSTIDLTSHYNIVYWYWELPEFPERWVDRFDLLDEIWVASDFVYQSLQSKTSLPVIKIPPSIGVEIDPQLTRADFGLPKDRFLFLCAYDAGSGLKRKNPEGAIRAFQEAFDPSDDSVGLVIKVNRCEEQYPLYQKMKRSLDDHPNIFFIEELLSRKKFSTLISLVDVYVSPHRSEGFGLIAAEAMYLGKPVIMTHWSGNVDFMRENNCCPVEYDLVRVGKANPVYAPDQIWAEPKHEEIVTYMERLATEPGYYSAIAKNAPTILKNNYSPQSIGEMISNRINSILNNPK